MVDSELASFCVFVFDFYNRVKKQKKFNVEVTGFTW